MDVTMERAGALALVLGTIAMIGLMALHPTSHATGSAKATMHLGMIVHAVAIATAPLLTFGFIAFTRSIGWNSPPAVLALVIYAFGSVAVMIAAAMSGLVAPQLMAWRTEGAADQALIHGLAHLGWFINQAFATIHVGLFSAAIALWAVSWPERGVLATLVQILGLLVGIGVFAWLVSGTLTLDVHGMGAVVLAQGLWIVVAAIALLQRDRNAARS